MPESFQQKIARRTYIIEKILTFLRKLSEIPTFSGSEFKQPSWLRNMVIFCTRVNAKTLFIIFKHCSDSLKEIISEHQKLKPEISSFGAILCSRGVPQTQLGLVAEFDRPGAQSDQINGVGYVSKLHYQQQVKWLSCGLC